MRKLVFFLAVSAFAQTGGWVVPGGGSGVKFVTTSPAGNACPASSVVNFNGTIYSCQAGVYAVLPSSGSAGVNTFNGRAGAVTLNATDVTAAEPARTGDVTAPAGGTVNTLATVNAAPGVCGDATHVGQVTVNGKGLTTACTPVAISGSGGMTVGAPVSGADLNSVLFADGSGNLLTHASLFSWDNFNQKLTVNGLHVYNFSGGAASWLDLPGVGPSGLGTDGPGQNVIAGRANTINDWFVGSLAGDYVYRAPAGNRLLFGVASAPGVTGAVLPSLIVNSGSVAANVMVTAPSLVVNGATSGAVTVNTPATVSSPYTLTLPGTSGTSGYVLQTDGTGVTSWVAQTGGGGGGAIPSTSITDFGTTFTSTTITVQTGRRKLGNSSFVIPTAVFTMQAPTISAASNSTPITVTVSSNLGIHNGDTVMVSGVLGNTGANGTWSGVTVSGTSITLPGSVGTGAYTSGGVMKGTGNGTVLIGANSSGEIEMYSSSSAGLIPTCTGSCIENQLATPALESDVDPLAQLTVTAGAITAVTDTRAFMGGRGISAGLGTTVTDIAGNAQIAVDSTVMRNPGSNVVTGTIDATSATRTAPNRSGSAAPTGQNCTVGDTYFQTGATAGSNIWGCTTTGTPGTWTLQGSSGGGSSAGITVTGQAWYMNLAPGQIWGAGQGSTTSDTISNGTSNQVWLYRITLPVPVAVSATMVNFTTADAGATADFGIYNIAGTSQLWHWNNGGGQSLSATGQVTASNPTVTLQPGVYWLAETESGTLGKMAAISGAASLQNNALVTSEAIAGNFASAGILPATLGTITSTTATKGAPYILATP